MALTEQALNPLYAGESRVLNNTISDSAGNPVNLSGATITFKAAKRRNGAAIITKSIGSGITVTNAGAGQHTVTLDPADTAALRGVLFWHIRVTDVGGRVSTTNIGTVAIYDPVE